MKELVRKTINRLVVRHRLEGFLFLMDQLAQGENYWVLRERFGASQVELRLLDNHFQQVYLYLREREKVREGRLRETA